MEVPIIVGSVGLTTRNTGELGGKGTLDRTDFLLRGHSSAIPNLSLPLFVPEPFTHWVKRRLVVSQAGRSASLPALKAGLAQRRKDAEGGVEESVSRGDPELRLGLEGRGGAKDAEANRRLWSLTGHRCAVTFFLTIPRR